MKLNNRPIFISVFNRIWPFLIVIGLLSGFIYANSEVKSGTIELKPDPGFGTNTDWNALIYDPYCELVEGPDGSVFVSSNRQHLIFKFDEAGELIKSFGQYGQGPGDFSGPHGLSILDGELLVVGEYALSYRISLFDLEGNFVKLLKTTTPVYNPIALQNSKIAYIDKSIRRNDKKSQLDVTATVIIKDVNSGHEIEVVQHNLTTHFEMNGQFMTTGSIIDEGNLFLVRSFEGDLIVGNSLQNTLIVYDMEGKKLKQIPLNLENTIITKSYVRDFWDARISAVKNDSTLDKEKKESRIKRMREMSLDYMIGRPRVGYVYLQTDSSGKILVYKSTDCVENCPAFIQFYSSEGKFLGEKELVGGNFDLNISWRWNTISFSETHILALVELRNTPEYTLRLIKVNLTD